MGKTEAPQHLVVGHVNKAHGTKGEVFIWPLTDHPDSTFASGASLLLGDGEAALPPEPVVLVIAESRAYRRGFLVRFEGVHDRAGSEALRDRYVLRDLDQVGTPEQGEVFYHDLLGMEAVTVDGRSVGEVVEVYELQAADLLEIRGPDKTHMIPYISSMVRSVDVEQNRVVLDPPDGLLDL